mmetsp:Transcript_17984/g.41963  ORF Transcript_17984/g.41963 Transcript_17984/m.41963 type:complete len:590 (+) Transcript_17984:246-2015(+)
MAEEHHGFVVHQKHRCDSCFVKPIVGKRYTSAENKNFDLCGRCFAKGKMEGLTVAPALDKDRVASRDFVLKLKLEKGAAVQVRRIRVSELFVQGKNLSYDKLMGVAAGFLDDIGKNTLAANSQVTYIDSDGDKINISSDEELNDSFEGILKKLPIITPFRITVSVSSNKDKPAGVGGRIPIVGATVPRRSGRNVSYSPAATLFANQPKAAQGPTADNALFIHGRHTCDSCSASPIVGTRYHSTKIPDFDLCTKCYDNYEGDKETDFQPQIHDRDLKMQKRWSKRQNRRAAKATGNVAGMWHRTNGDLVEFLKNIQEQTGTLIESAEIIQIPKDEGTKKTEESDAKVQDVNLAAARSPTVAEKKKPPVQAGGAADSFLDDAEGSIAEAIGKTLDVCMQAIEDAADKSTAGGDGKMPTINIKKIDAITSDALSIASSAITGVTEALQQMEEVNRDVVSASTEPSTSAVAPGSKSDERKASAKVGDILSDDEESEQWSIVSDDKARAKNAAEIVRDFSLLKEEQEEDVSILSVEPLSPVLVAKWDEELRQLRELGFRNERQIVDVLEGLEAAHLMANSDDKISLDAVINKLV